MADAKQMDEEDAKSSVNSGHEPLIFVVDDERIVATTLALILQSRGIFVRSFVDPIDVLRAVEVGPPDVLLADVVMPQMNGIELGREIKRRCPGCKVLLFSGEIATAELLEKARRLGQYYDVLAKPVHPEVLIQMITAMVTK